MKKNIFMMLVILVTTYANSQNNDFVCATTDAFTDEDPNGTYSRSIDPIFLESFEPIVFNVYYWGINEDDGSSTNKLTENDALKAIAALNIKFNSFNIFFKYRGYDYIDSSRFYTVYSVDNPNDLGEDSSYEALITYARSNNYQYYKNDAINIYAPRATNGFSGVAWAWRTIVLNSFALEDAGRVINHEMGHALGLSHTHKDWNKNYCEHVTRNKYLSNGTLNLDFNADEAGDKIVDTAAVPDFRNELCEELGYEYPYTGCTAEKYAYIDSLTCTYFGNGSDCLLNPVDYEISTEDVRNLMAYTWGTCGLKLTIGQGIYMREWIQNHPYMYVNRTTSLVSLYEPYRGEYYLAGPNLPEDRLPLFQPGFEYRFVECSGPYPQPADTTDVFSYNINNPLLIITRNETDYTSITHPNHSAILIKHEYSNELDEPLKCYDNYNKAPIGGTVIKFNDNVLNTNVTITPQDSTAINNQYLIQNLETGLYKIEKNYEDGSTKETLIFKENN